MAVTWEIEPNHIIEKIESVRSVEGANVNFAGFDTWELVNILFGMAKFSDAIAEEDARKIFENSLFTVGTKGAITPKSLKAELNKQESIFLQTGVSRYVLLTSLSLRSEYELSRINFGHNQVIFDGVPPRFHKEAKPLLDRATARIFSKPPDNYLPVRVHVSTRSIYEAADKAFDHLDLIRATWNLFYNRRIRWRQSMEKAQPVNTIIAGPIHTLHKTNGELATDDTFWYDSSFVEPVRIQNVSLDIDKLYDFMKHIRERLSKIAYADIVENALRRYVRALDERDWNNAYLRLWGVLELLTDTSTDRYDVTIRRASYVFDERHYYSRVLQHLRNYRNRLVHHAASDSGIESYLYQLKNIVEEVIQFHLRSSFGFSTIQEAARFLNLPYKKDDLELRYSMTNYALKFRRYK